MQFKQVSTTSNNTIVEYTSDLYNIHLIRDEGQEWKAYVLRNTEDMLPCVECKIEEDNIQFHLMPTFNATRDLTTFHDELTLNQAVYACLQEAEQLIKSVVFPAPAVAV